MAGNAKSGGMPRIVWVGGLAVLFINCASCGVIRRGPQDVSAITYGVSYADLSAGTADVSYTDSDGRTVNVRVSIPWTSGTISVRPGQSYRLNASAADSGTNLSCEIHLDSGVTAGNSLRNGKCDYTFPDDLDK